MCLVRAGETAFSLFGNHSLAPFLIAEESAGVAMSHILGIASRRAWHCWESCCHKADLVQTWVFDPCFVLLHHSLFCKPLALQWFAAAQDACWGFLWPKMKENFVPWTSWLKLARVAGAPRLWSLLCVEQQPSHSPPLFALFKPMCFLWLLAQHISQIDVLPLKERFVFLTAWLSHSEG